MSKEKYVSYEKMRSAAEDAVVTNVLSAIISEELSGGFLGVIPVWDIESIRVYVGLLNSLVEKNCDREVLAILRLLCNASNLAYPSSLEWAEKDPVFLHSLLCEMCEDFEEILTEEHDQYVHMSGEGVAEDEDSQEPGDSL